jgi:DNA repair exonuclease SbcCD nuclease subunit
MTKFLHTADLHLDSPLKGLSNHEHAPQEQIRGASRAALTRIVTLAIKEQVTFVIIAGDLYDGDWQDYSTGQFFNAEMRRLQQKGIKVYLLFGNHDAQSKITRQLSLPDNVFVFDTKVPETFLLEEHAIALHGQGFATQHVHDRLALDYPAAVADSFNIGVLHTQVEGHQGHAPYAPCTLAELNAKDYQYWALGHVHQPEILQESPTPVVYAGIPQGRHIRETKEKGCYLASVDDSHQLVDLTFHPLETLRWEHLEVDVSIFSDWEDIESHLAATILQLNLPTRIELAVFRVTLNGQSGAHEELLRLEAALALKLQEHLFNENLPFSVWIEKVRNQTTPLVDIAELRQADELTDFVLTHWEKEELDLDSLGQELQSKLGSLLTTTASGEDESENSLYPTKEEVRQVILSTLKSSTPSSG